MQLAMSIAPDASIVAFDASVVIRAAIAVVTLTTSAVIVIVIHFHCGRVCVVVGVGVGVALLVVSVVTLIFVVILSCPLFGNFGLDPGHRPRPPRPRARVTAEPVQHAQWCR